MTATRPLRQARAFLYNSGMSSEHGMLGALPWEAASPRPACLMSAGGYADGTRDEVHVQESCSFDPREGPKVLRKELQVGARHLHPAVMHPTDTHTKLQWPAGLVCAEHPEPARTLLTRVPAWLPCLRRVPPGQPPPGDLPVEG